MQKTLEIYVSKILPQFGPSRDTNLFLTSEGKAFPHGTLCKRLPEFWVTATNIRKWIVTICHQRKQEGLMFDEMALRQAMCHSKKTAQTFYLREDLIEVAARATEIIAQCTSSAADPLNMPANLQANIGSPCELASQPMPGSLQAADLQSIENQPSREVASQPMPASLQAADLQSNEDQPSREVASQTMPASLQAADTGKILEFQIGKFL